MDLKDQFKYLVGGYYGIKELDEYKLKEYLLKEIEDYIHEFFKQNPISDFDYEKEQEEIKDNMPIKTKLQDALLVLNRIKAPIEITILVKLKIKEIEKIKEVDG